MIFARDHLPLLHRHLLDRDNNYFRRARISALKSWLRRIKLATKPSNKKTTNDIREWIRSGNSPTDCNDESSIASDDTENWIRMYPDEDPILDVWDKCKVEELFNESSENFVSTPFIPWQT